MMEASKENSCYYGHEKKTPYIIHRFDLCNLYQLFSILLWIEQEMKLANDEYGGIEVVCRETLCQTKVDIFVTDKDKIRIISSYGEREFSAMQVSAICRRVEKMLNKLILVDGFDCRNFQPKYMALFLSKIFPAFVKEELDYEYLKELRVNDTTEFQYLEFSERVRALEGKLNIDTVAQKASNSIGQTNSTRLFKCLCEVKERGYPYQEQYIILYNHDLRVMDGAHRAACLYHLYGNIRVPVKRLYFDWNRLFGRGICFPFDRVWKKEEGKGTVKVIIYGAGYVGQIFMEQVQRAEGTIQVVLWVDQRYLNIKQCGVDSPEKIKVIEYDYIIIAVEKGTMADEIRENLKLNGVEDVKIVWKRYFQE